MIVISGKVVKGQQYGRVLGFPTANIDRRDFSRKRMKIRLGVYAGYAVIGPAIGRPQYRHYAAIVIGPIDRTGLPKLEAHLLGFKGNLYGKRLSVTLQKYLRPFKKFKDVETLKKQIASDIKKVNSILLSVTQ